MEERFLHLVRGIVRPSLTWLGFIAALLFVYLKIDLPEWMQTMIAMMVAFWFSQRVPPNGEPKP